MELLLLPGNSLRNREWIRTVERSLEDLFSSTHVLEYQHWGTGEKLIDFEVELKELEKLVEGIEDYAVFAKSAGVLLALNAVYEGKITPKKCIFVGSAIGMGKKMGIDFEKWFRNFSIPTLWIQKSEDPAMSFAGVREFVKGLGVRGGEFVEISGDDHVYLEIRELHGHIEKFV